MMIGWISVDFCSSWCREIKVKYVKLLNYVQLLLGPGKWSLINMSVCVTATSVFVAFAQCCMLKACLYFFVNDQLSLQIVLQ